MDSNAKNIEAAKLNNVLGQSESKTALVPSFIEKAALPVSYVIAYLYTYIFTIQSSSKLFLAGFVFCFSLGAELVFHKRKVTWESIVWLACLWISLIGFLIGRNQVWGNAAIGFLHLYAVYWLLVRSGHLMEGESGAFVPIDLLNGLIILPFRRFFLRLRILWSLANDKTKNKGSAAAKIAIFIVFVISILLFYLAAALLSAADPSFDHLFGNFLRLFQIDNFGEVLFRFLISLPIGAYLYGLVVGIRREEPERLQEQKAFILKILESLRKVPVKIWLVFLAAFSLLYLSFFLIQGSYLFGAFAHRLPENFTVAQYARQGFFELCGILALNFTLLLVVILSSSDIRQQKSLRLMSTILLCESILFSLTALSKLFLYISNFGLTPLRLQSSWLVCALFLGCIAALYSLWTGKKSMKLWLLYSGVTLALLHLY